ncbi:hypothetical protein Tco_1083977 [Tanacetum coccineum]
MSSKNTSSKFTKKPKISVRPIWRKKLNYCNSSNEVDVQSQTTMSRPQTLYNYLPKENPLIVSPNHASPLPQSPSLFDHDVNVVLQENQNLNPTPPPPPPSPS